MNNEKQYHGKLDEQSLIFRQIDRINDLITMDLRSTNVNSWNIYFQKIELSLNALESILSPMRDETYEENMKKKIKDEPEGDNKREMDKKTSVRVQNFKIHFAELIKLLHRNSVYFGESGDFVIDKEEGEATVME